MQPIGKLVFYAALMATTLSACSNKAEVERNARAAAVVVTPGSYYTTEKARVLASDYATNLNTLVLEIKRNETTSGLQLANNLESPGGLGFFTHSEVRHPDDRYLEVVVMLPEILDAKEPIRTKLDSIMSKYGLTLLEILANDSKIYGDDRIAGYGLNLGWRESATDGPPTDARVALYVQKQTARRFVADKVNLEGLVVFEFVNGQWVRTAL